MILYVSSLLRWSCWWISSHDNDASRLCKNCVEHATNSRNRIELPCVNRILPKDTIILQSTVGYRNIPDAFKIIYSQRGLAGFTCGMQARVIFQMPATALSWSVYELFKYVLGYTTSST
ncbi:hypothetical protein OSTOST_16770 [Ostertagia ostertagi]